MDPFDIFFKKFAYKFPKGYPDMNNEQDILLSENLLSKITQESVIIENQDLINTLNKSGKFSEYGDRSTTNLKRS